VLDANHQPGEVAVPHAQREDLPASQSREGRRQEDGAVLLVGRHAHDRPNLLRAVEVEAARVCGREALDIVHRVRGEAVGLAGALEDPVQDRDQLVRGAPRQPSLSHLKAAPLLDRSRGHVLKLAGPEGRDQMRVHG
jgi:hypothetical protein